MKLFLDSMVGGAWPFLVGGVICLVNSVNERDLDLLNSTGQLCLPPILLGGDQVAFFLFGFHFLEGLSVSTSRWKFEAITGL